MSFGKVCIKHFECACRNILSFETVLLNRSVNVDVSYCFIMDISRYNTGVLMQKLTLCHVIISRE